MVTGDLGLIWSKDTFHLGCIEVLKIFKLHILKIGIHINIWVSVAE